ncbi:hypothetical protein [Stutzerimonas nitrititolerans]|uniref:hypothetical protein n=1 Tax=Stutzerimonas nitrititolerans TaxID=2482751 RepID=UPI00289ECC42|nr:hypothetical protein [Stutzerimonas nitrititolerans]
MSSTGITEFTISYDAPGDLEMHTIDAKDLGTAIIGMHDLISNAANIVSNGSSEADLKVIAPAKEGSLEIVYAIVADPVTTLAVMKNIGIGVAGAIASTATAIGIMDRLKDKKIERVIIDTKTDKARLITADGEIETTGKVAQLVASKDVRQAMHRVFQAPTQGREGAKVKLMAAQGTVELDEDEIKNFVPIKTDVKEKETKTRFQKIVCFTKLNFKSRRGWTIQSKDGLEAGVTIRDDVFLQKVAKSEEAFESGKYYTVEIEKIETVKINETLVKYDIINVINEISP